MADLREQIQEVILDHRVDVLDYGTREACSCGEYRWSSKHVVDAMLAVVEPAIRAAQAQALRQYAGDLKANSCADMWDLPDFVNDIRDYAGEIAAGDIDVDPADRDGTPDAPQQSTQPRAGARTDGTTPDAGQAASGDESA